MNEFQDYILKKIRMESDDAKISWSGDSLTITQNEDYRITQYHLRIKMSSKYDRLVLSAGDRKIEPTEHPCCTIYDILIDFDDRFDYLTLASIDDVFDPIMIRMQYVAADREKFDALLARQRHDAECAKVGMTVRTGADLINVLFSPLSENYAYSEIELYAKQSPEDKDIGRLMGKYRNEKDRCCIAVTNLACGAYHVRLTQYDKADAPIFSDDKDVVISKPGYPHNNRKPIVGISGIIYP